MIDLDGSTAHARAIYTELIREALPRVLSTLDREPVSKSFGCADRVFWCWKFTDFPGARFQEITSVLTSLSEDLALVESSEGRETLRIWSMAAISYWARLQHADGSFDEAYPYERSLAATAFTGFYVGRAFLKIKHAYSEEEKAGLIKIFAKAGAWLCHNDERHGVLSNHLAAAAAALDTIAEITGDKKFEDRRDYFINRIMERQAQEGWYEEYGGADPGYQTHTTFYLGYIWSRTKNRALLESLRRSVRYFWYFLHPDGSLGGEYASRNTRFFMPAGFEILAAEIPEAATVALHMRAALLHHRVVGLQAMDAYNVLPFLNNYFFARSFATALDENALPPLPVKAEGMWHFKESGHVIISTSRFQAIIATSKGGVVSAYAKEGGGQWQNSGIAMEFENGRKSTSQGLHCSVVRHVAHESVDIESYFTEVNQVLMSPDKLIVFRLISLISIPFPAFAYYLKNALVKMLVRRKKPCAMRLLRKISWSDRQIKVVDRISAEKTVKVRKIWVGGKFAAIHMGSSRYFGWQELEQAGITQALEEAEVAEFNRTGVLVLERQWHALEGI